MTETRPLLLDAPLFATLPGDAREALLARFVPLPYSFGATIAQEGETADAFYVVATGRVRVVGQGPGGEDVSIGQLQAGESFGEQELLDGGTWTATVRASSAVTVLRLERADFEALLREWPEVRRRLEAQAERRRLHAFLRLQTRFGRLPADTMRTLVDSLAPLAVPPGQRVIQEGDPPGPMYLVREGRLRTFQKVEGRRQYRGYLRGGDSFGEAAVLRREPQWASVEAVTACSLLVVGPDRYEELLTRSPEFRAAVEARVAEYDDQRTVPLPLDFAQEILPAETSVFHVVGIDQVDQIDADAATAERAVGSRDGDGRPAKAAPPPAPDGPDRRSGTRRRRIRRFPHVQQIDEMDCGAACLAMVCRHFGRRVPLTRIRALTHVSLDGTSLRGICRAATELGLAARSVKSSPRQLGRMPLPAVVHWDGNHWVVLYDVDETHVRVADPALGSRRLTRAEFEARWSGYAALFDYTEAFAHAPVGRTGFGWLLPFVRPYRGTLLQAVGLALMVSALQMVLPVLTQVIVDRVLVERDVGLLHTLMVAMLGLLVFVVLGIVLQRYLLSFAAVRVDSSTLDALTRTLLALPMSYFNTRRTGDIQRRLAGLRALRHFFVEHGVAVIAALAQLAAALVLMALYSPLLTGVFLATAPVYLLMMRFASHRLRPLYGALEEEDARYGSYQIDAIKGIETVKALGAEASFREVMLANFHEVARRRFRADFMTLTYNGGVQAVTVLTTTLFLWVGALQVMAGALTIGALVAFNALVAMANAPVFVILSAWDNLQMARVHAQRLDDVLDQEPEQGADHSRLLPVRTLEGRISFRRLGFRYGGPESPAILDDITFDVAPATRVAIVGRSGSGKTTLIKCLAGLLEPTDGTILYDGVDLRTLDYRDLRRKIGFVLQETFLFSDTIARNIAFGEEEPDMPAVVLAAKAANAHEFVERLPLGYDTKVGESGLALSGGQRQRIAIARALYHRPPILVFDEATAALDTESERAVTRNIGHLLEGRTSFVIAHRLSTVRDADQILVIEQGRLIERGTHDELMARQGLYYFLVSQQLGL